MTKWWDIEGEDNDRGPDFRVGRGMPSELEFASYRNCFRVADDPLGITSQSRPYVQVSPQVRIYLVKGMSDCFEVHPTLGVEPQNILFDGMYVVIFPVGVVREKTWKRQFRTS